MKSDISIKSLTQQGESETLEFLNNVNQDAIGKTICGFLNCNGGILLIGIGNKGEVLGLPNAEAELESVKGYLSKSIIPEAPIDLRIESVSKKNILFVKVWPGSRKPYVFAGTIFYRRSDRNVQATSKELADLLHDRKVADLQWERIPASNVFLDDLNKKDIQEVILHSKENGRGKVFAQNDIDNFLSYYSLIQNGGLTNAAVVLFAKEPVRFLPQVRVRIAALHEGKTSSGFKSDRFFEGNLIDNVRVINEHLSNLLKLDRKFNRLNWERTQGFQYPMDAISEGVLNALVHRNYTDSSSTVNIIILPDRLEISNSGALPPGWTTRDLKKSHQSLPQNPDIAHVCFLRGYIDKIGTGTLKIIDACKNAGLREPKWTTEGSFVKLTFFNNVSSVPRSEGVFAGVNEGVSKEKMKKIEGVIGGVTEGVTEGVKERIRQIVIVLSKEEGINTSQIALLLNVPIKSLERYIRQLKNNDIIEFRGAPKSGGYFLTKHIHRKINS